VFVFAEIGGRITKQTGNPRAVFFFHAKARDGCSKAVAQRGEVEAVPGAGSESKPKSCFRPFKKIKLK